MFTVMLSDMDKIIRPRANMPAKSMPMDVSSPRPVRWLTKPMRTAKPIPVGTATSRGLKPNRMPRARPGMTPWARASPMKERLRVIT